MILRNAYFDERIKQMRRSMKARGLDGYFTSSEQNIFYLTGYKDDNSMLLITRKNILLGVSGMNLSLAKKFLAGRSAVKIELLNSFYKFVSTSDLKKLGYGAGLVLEKYRYLKKIKGLHLVYNPGLIEELRSIKDDYEISQIRISCDISKRAAKFAFSLLKNGITEKQLTDEIELFFRRNGALKSAFDLIAASGKNSAYPHHQVSERKIGANEIVVLDIGCMYRGYCSDLTRTFLLGKIKKYYKTIYNIVSEARSVALRTIKPGVAARDLDAVARGVIKAAGYEKYFLHSLGHGVGTEVHEYPYLSPKSSASLKQGMVLAVEPGIYLPDKFGMRIEDTVIVTEKGCEVLTDDFNF
ncbi:MAG: putative peptidase [Elusimicrobia bacterium ADurb.Bin231]|nr:MAG: putative peptidase [Elusimicrobia bacterium ADurb.Bin231]